MTESPNVISMSLMLLKPPILIPTKLDPTDRVVTLNLTQPLRLLTKNLPLYTLSPREIVLSTHVNFSTELFLVHSYLLCITEPTIYDKETNKGKKVV